MLNLLKGLYSFRIAIFFESLFISIFFLMTSTALSQNLKGVILEKRISIESQDLSVYKYLPDQVEFSLYHSETATTPVGSQIFPKGKFKVDLKTIKADGYISGISVRFRVKFTNKIYFDDIPEMSDPAKGIWLDISIDGIPAGTRDLVPDSTLVRLLLSSDAPVSTYRAFVHGSDGNRIEVYSPSLSKSEENTISDTFYSNIVGIADTGGSTTTTTTTTSATTTTPTTSTTSTTLTEVVVYVDASGSCGVYSPCYSTIQSAIDSVKTGTTLKIEEGNYYEDLILNDSKNLLLQCGFQDTFTSQTAETVTYSLTVSNDGMVTVDNLILYTEGSVTTTTTATTTTTSTTSTITPTTSSSTTTTNPAPPAQPSPI
jgi:hypothetical protein